MTGAETPVPAAPRWPQGRAHTLGEHLALALLATPLARIGRVARWAARRAYLPTATSDQLAAFLTLARTKGDQR